MTNFSKHMTFLRENRGITQKDMAKRLGISLHGYQRLEYGEQEPRMSLLIALADFYEMTLDELVCREWPREMEKD